MTVFDQYYYAVFSFYKKRYKQKANTIALVYVSVLQISLLLLLGCFFAAFFNQMHTNIMSSNNALALFVLIAIGIHFKNWMQYTGKKRMMINAKMIKKNKSQTSIWLLAAFPFIILALAYVIYQAV